MLHLDFGIAEFLGEVTEREASTRVRRRTE